MAERSQPSISRMESAPDPGLEHVPSSSPLGPRHVGQRVVVRSRVPGETGPTGGPAFTDVLGVLESWVDGVLTLRTENDDLVEIPAALVVSGKPVPPRPSRFSRISADEVEHRCVDFARWTEAVELGDWLLRVTDGTNPLASAAILAGDPGMPLDQAIDTTAEFYARRDRQPVARVVVGSSIDEHLTGLGWRPLDVERADNEVHLAGVAALARRLVGVDTSGVVHEATVSYDWLVGNDRAQANFAAVAASLDLRDATFGSISEDGEQVARARANVVSGWTFLADLFVRPDRRERGLARTMMAAMTEWAAERGATVMALQVAADNTPAQRLYADLGFERHHRYRYLTG
ncbi:MAG: GNAT family N-acetyltransferase [Marmoricola sp.]